MAPRTLPLLSAGRLTVALLALAFLALALAAGLGAVLATARSAGERPPAAAETKAHVL
jgi:hypothetical protein